MRWIVLPPSANVMDASLDSADPPGQSLIDEVVTSGTIDPLTEDEDGRAVGGTGLAIPPETRRVFLVHAPSYITDDVSVSGRRSPGTYAYSPGL